MSRADAPGLDLRCTSPGSGVRAGRASPTMEELNAMRLTGLVKVELLAIDDWLLAPLRDSERRDLVEVIEDRSDRSSTLVASLLPAKDTRASGIRTSRMPSVIASSAVRTASS
jgi:hypothetical protein